MYVYIVHTHELEWFDLCPADEIKPREITPGGFDIPATFELNFSVEMVDGVAKLINNRDEVSLQTLDGITHVPWLC